MMPTHITLAMNVERGEKKDATLQSWNTDKQGKLTYARHKNQACVVNTGNDCPSCGKRPKLEMENKEEHNDSDKQLLVTRPELLCNYEENQPNSSGITLRGMLLRALDENLLFFCKVARNTYNKSHILPSDRDKLLLRNRELFLNFILGQCFKEENKVNLSWLTSRVSSTDLDNLNFKNANSIVATLQILTQDKVLQNFYLRFAQSLSSCKINPSCKEELARALSLYPGSLDLTQGAEVSKRFHETTMNLSNGEGHLIPLSIFHETCQTLEAMSELLRQTGLTEQLFWHQPIQSSLAFSLDFREEEENWLFGIRDQTFAAMASVHMSSNIIQDVFNYLSHRIPFPANHMASMAKLVRERMFQTYLTHPEFREMKDAERNSIVRTSLKMLLSLVLSLIDLTRHSIREQAQLLLPPEQYKSEQDKTLTMLMRSGSCGVNCRDAVPTLSPEWEGRSLKVQAGLRNAGDQDGMWLFALMSTCLFNNLNSGRGLGLVKKWLDASFTRRYGFEFEARAQRTFQDLRELSHLLQDFD